MTTTALEAAQAPLQRPRQSATWRKRLGPFIGTPVNAVITAVSLALLVWALAAAYRWGVTDAITDGGPQACKGRAGGACWPFLAAKLRFMVFGYFPYDQHWRPLAALLVFFSACGITMMPRFWSRRLVGLWAGAFAVIGVLMYGGVLGLPVVETTKWGGLPLSFMLAFVGLSLGFPLGVILALARMSKMPAIRVLAVVFIEVIRGVPLISILFMATVMLPLFMPDGITIDKLLRAQVAIIIFAAAYIAETVRGGLQAIPRGQFEAAGALGLHYWQSMRLIILPQALKIVIPPLVNTFIGFFQDTTLVIIVGLLDFLDTVRSAMRDPDWQGIAVVEGYVFAGAVYFVFSYGMGAYSRFLERRQRRGYD